MSIICRVGNRQVKRTGFRVFSFLKETNDDALDSSRNYFLYVPDERKRGPLLSVLFAFVLLFNPTLYIININVQKSYQRIDFDVERTTTIGHRMCCGQGFSKQ